MTRRARLTLFLTGAVGFVVVAAGVFSHVPEVGTSDHPYRDRAVHASVTERHTANVVASVTFDQRGLDTLGEEFLFLAAVLGTGVLMRSVERRGDPHEAPGPGGRRGSRAAEDQPHVHDATRLAAYVLLPLTLLVGLSLVTHGHISPGGGFQGGVVLASAIHLLYLGGDLESLRRVRPVPVFDVAEAVGAGAFVVLGLAAMLTGAAFLANTLPTGMLGGLASAGTVPLFNVAVGLEVGSGVVLLLARFLEQAIVLPAPEADGR